MSYGSTWISAPATLTCFTIKYCAHTDYQDHPERERRRHLLRLWLSGHNARALSAVFAERDGDLGAGKRRGGIHVPGEALDVRLNVE